MSEPNWYNLRTKYGLSQKDYQALLADQHNVCAICGEPPKGLLHVDHDHESGFVRGLLCNTCNAGLGMFKDNIRLLAGAIVYLQDFGKK